MNSNKIIVILLVLSLVVSGTCLASPKYESEIRAYVENYNAGVRTAPISSDRKNLMIIDPNLLVLNYDNQSAHIINGNKKWVVAFTCNSEHIESISIFTVDGWQNLSKNDGLSFEGACIETSIRAAEVLARSGDFLRIDGRFNVWSPEPEVMKILFKNGKIINCVKSTRKENRVVTITSEN